MPRHYRPAKPVTTRFPTTRPTSPAAAAGPDISSGAGRRSHLTTSDPRLIAPSTRSASALPHIRSGGIKVYGVTDKTRLSTAPDIPTVDEAGLPGFQLAGWHALFVPKSTPKAVIGMLNSAVVDALADPNVRKRLIALGQEFYPREQLTPAALAAYQKAEIEKWWPIIKAAGIKVE